MNPEVSTERKLIGCLLIFFSLPFLSLGLLILWKAFLRPLMSGGKIELWPTGAGFAFVLVAAFLATLGSQMKSRRQPKTASQPGDRPNWIPTTPVELFVKGHTKRWMNFWQTWIAATLICVTVFFVLQNKMKPYFNDVSSAAPFLAPLALLYIGVLGYTFFRACGPSPFVQMNRREVKPGEKMQLAWELKGMQGVTRKLTIEMIGRESLFIHGRAGKRNVSGENVFITIPLFETRNPAEMQRYFLDVNVAPGSMHSFIATAIESFLRNYECKISWAIRFRGDVSYWPDFNDEIDFVMLPE